MVESSKILTVSYGTFSCTLEGFDDSFSTMKAIAEYFRDLAAGDRYFGAEPPTPDAEMLTRIAEREISRKVEARTDDSGIVLRAAALTDARETAAPAMPPAMDAPEMPSVAERQRSAPEPEVPSVEEAEDGFDAMTPPPAQAPASDGDSVAAKLQRIRAVVGQGGADFDAGGDDLDEGLLPDTGTDMASGFVPEAEEAANDDHPVAAEEDDDDAPEDEGEESVVAHVADMVAELDVAPPMDDRPDEPEDDIGVVTEEEAVSAEPAMTEETADEPEPEDDDTDRSDADTSGDVEVSIVDEDVSDPETNEDDVSGFDASDDEITGTTDEDVSEPDTMDADRSTPETANEDADDAEAEKDAEPVRKPLLRSRILRLGRRVKAPAAERPEPEEAPVVAAQIDTTDLDARNDAIADTLAARLAAMADADADPDAGDLAATPEPTMSSAFDVSDAYPVEDDAEDEVSDAADAEEAEVPSAEEDDAQESPEPDAEDTIDAAEDGFAQVDEDAAETEDDLSAPATADTSLSEDDEAELREELAHVEREAAQARDSRHGRAILPETDDAAMDRISAEADRALEEPEGRNRRNAIAQLKAAVAATEAARQLGDKAAAPEEAEQPFREDLEDAVRPTRPARPVRPERGETRTERPRPAPLKLVASQRIDAPAPQDSTPVQPRRVASDDAPVDAANFAEFASEMGAQELPDLLEAAAAYTAYVEGVEDFSRPQIMKKVQATARTAFSREDGLRSFGTLLREGRISKVRNGRFQVSEATRFKPEQKAG